MQRCAESSVYTQSSIVPFDQRFAGARNEDTVVKTKRTRTEKKDHARDGTLEGFPEDLIREIFSALLHQQSQLSLPTVSKEWKKVYDHLIPQWPYFQRSRILDRIIPPDYYHNLTHQATKPSKLELMKDYSFACLNSHSAYQFLKGFFCGCWLAHETVTHSFAIMDLNTRSLDDKKLLETSVEKKMYSLAFAYALHNERLKLSRNLFKLLIDSIDYEKTLYLIFIIGAEDEFLNVFIRVGCRNLKALGIADGKNIYRLSEHAFTNLLLKRFSQCPDNESRQTLPISSINILLSELIIPLSKCADKTSHLDYLKEVLVKKLYGLIPRNFTEFIKISIRSKLESIYKEALAYQLFELRRTRMVMSQDELKIFISTIDRIPHQGLKKAILSKILAEFYNIFPDMDLWWSILRNIEKRFSLFKFNSSPAFPGETQATEEYMKYLLEKQRLINVLQGSEIVSGNNETFRHAVILLLQQCPSWFNCVEQEFLTDSKIVSDESSTSEVSIADASSLQDYEIGDYSSDFSMTQPSIEFTENEICEIYECIIALLLKNKKDDVAQKVICAILKPSLKVKVMNRFPLIKILAYNAD